MAALCSVLFASPALAATLNVPGSYPTIQSAINAGQDGDTIQVAAGTYYENLVWNDTALTLAGAGAATTIIDGGGLHSVLFLTNVPATATVKGFTIRNGHSTFQPDWANVGGGVILLNS